MARNERGAALVGVLMAANIGLAALAFQPTKAAAKATCDDEGCVLDRCTEYTGYNCSKLANGCAGGKCASKE